MVDRHDLEPATSERTASNDEVTEHVGRESRVGAEEDSSPPMFAHGASWEATAPALEGKPMATASGKPSKLRMVSFNLQVAKLQQTEIRFLKRASADVICLQEAKPANAQKLAGILHMDHATYPGAGLAILSRYPIEKKEKKRFGGYSPKARDKAEKRVTRQLHRENPKLSKKQLKKKAREARKPRGELAVTISINGEKLDVLNTHLSLKDTASNTRQLKELAGDVRAREQNKHHVLVAGDFNTNFGLARGGKAGGKTDTTREWKQRYGKTGKRSEVGNIASGKNKQAVRALLRLLQQWWAKSPSRVVHAGGKTGSPEAMAKSLRHAKPGTKKWKRLMMAVDGITHEGLRRQIDQVLASSGLTFERSEIHRVKGSDHNAVIADVKV